MFLPFFFLSEYFYCLYLFGSGSFHSRWGLVESRASITVNDVLFFIYLYSLCHIVSLRFLPFNRFSGLLFSSGATLWPVNYLTVHEKRQFWSSCIKSFFRDPWHMWCTAGEQSSTEDCKITHFTTMDITHLRIAYNSMKVRQCKLSKEQWFTLPASIPCYCFVLLSSSSYHRMRILIIIFNFHAVLCLCLPGILYVVWTVDFWRGGEEPGKIIM